MGKSLIFITFLALTGCSHVMYTSNAEGPQPAQLTDPLRDAAELSVRSRLRDPDSAQFRKLHATRQAETVYVCGEVNAKNGYGGYDGFEPFYVASSGEIWLTNRYTPASVIEQGPPICR